MSAPLHTQISALIREERYRVTLDSDLANVIAEWSKRASYQEIVAALARARASLDGMEPQT